MSPHRTITARPALRQAADLQPALWALILAGLLLAGCIRGPAGPIDRPVTSTSPPPPDTPPPETPPIQTGDATSPTPPPPVDAPPDNTSQPPSTRDSGTTGVASYYGHRFAGQRTASGERFDPGELTAAHPSLPFGTRVRVTNLDNGEQVTVRVNDRGPFVGSRIIDLSRQAAERIEMIHDGVAQVRIQVLQ